MLRVYLLSSLVTNYLTSWNVASEIGDVWYQTRQYCRRRFSGGFGYWIVPLTSDDHRYWRAASFRASSSWQLGRRRGNYLVRHHLGEWVALEFPHLKKKTRML